MSEASTSRPPLVSVTVIFLDAEPFLSEAIDSVRRQTYARWELLLVDDGSTDGSTDIAREAAAREPERIRYLEHAGHRNLGMSASRNLGIAHSKGDLLAFLDADDVYLPQKLERQVEALSSHPAAGMMFGTTEYWYSWTGRDEDRGRDYRSRCDFASSTVIQPPDLVRLFLQGLATVPCIGSVLLRRRAIERVGGFESTFRGMFEDQVLYAKLGLEIPVLVSCECHDRYRQHSQSCFSRARESGEVLASRERYLLWYQDYLQRAGRASSAVGADVRRALWLCRHPRVDRQWRRWQKLRRRLSRRR